MAGNQLIQHTLLFASLISPPVSLYRAKTNARNNKTENAGCRFYDREFWRLNKNENSERIPKQGKRKSGLAIGLKKSEPIISRKIASLITALTKTLTKSHVFWMVNWMILLKNCGNGKEKMDDLTKKVCRHPREK